MRFYSQKLWREFNKLIFKALESRVWSFVDSGFKTASVPDSKTHSLLNFVKIVVAKNPLKTATLLFGFVLCITYGTTQIFAANAPFPNTDLYEYQTINILPGSVTGEGWKNIENALTQEVTDDALVHQFGNSNSAYIVSFETDEKEVNLVPSGDAVNELDDGTELNEGETEVVPEENETPATDDVEAEQSSDPLDNAPGDASSDTTLEAMSKGFFLFVDRATKMLPFANESTITPLEEVESTETVIETTEEALSPVVEVETETQNAEEEIEVTEQEAPIVENSDTGEVTEVVEPESSLPESICGDAACYRHVMEFGDFGVGEGFSEQQITNMQLRVSLGGRAHKNATEGQEQIRIEYLHYDYWIDGGVIPITEEVSNALNGGYFLFGFPLYSDWDEMSRIKVRLTYESNNVELSDVFVDSVWLEVESIDNNAFNEPVPEAAPEVELPKKLLRAVPPEYDFKNLSRITEFDHDETPRFTFNLKRLAEEEGFFKRLGNGLLSLFGFGNEEVAEKKPMRMRVIDDVFKGIAQVSEEGEGMYNLDIPKMRQFKPGRHVVTIEVTDGNTVFYIDQEFSWGVLALNTDKTIYLPDEEVYLQMGVLDDLGHTLCDAKLDLEIKNPQGVIQYLSTDNGTIKYGEECAGDTFTTSPDYDALYELRDGVGTYELKLTATTDNGVHTISDSIQVQDNVSFDVVRTGPTRIYPPELYPVTLTITAEEDYVGEIIELIPVSFQAYEVGGDSFRTHEIGDAKQLIWDVALEAGETITLKYRFDAPDISPEFYLLGPLSIGSFVETREWQIASDAPSNATIVQSIMGTDTSATSYSATFATPPTAGNTIIMVATHRDGASAFNAPASYLTQAVLSNASTEIDTGIWYAPANAATSTYTITKTGGNQTGVVYLMEVSGLDTTNLLDVTSSLDQTGSNSLTASTSLSATSTPYAFAVAGITFADNDFAVPTSASWTSGSTNTYTQRATISAGAANDGTFSIATANIQVAARQGATQVLTVGGTEQRNSVLAVFRLRPQVNTVGARGNQTTEIKRSTANNYVGGAFTFTTDNGSSTITSITVSEAGTTNALNDLSNIRLRYEMDSVAPYDCASGTYDGTETQYGATSTSFSSANGTSTFSGSVSISTTSAMCVYTILDVDASATLGDTIELQVTNPSTQVITSTGSSSPGTAVAISDTSTIVIGFSPNVPILAATSTFASMKATTTQPSFGGFAATDADGDAVVYEFSIDDDPYFASPATTTYSTNYPTDAGWASTTFASGATTTYRIQQALTVGTTYWWRVRARDPLNTNNWGSYSAIRSITIGSNITVPEWFQTTDMQFSTTTTLSNATTSGGSAHIEDLDISASLLDAWTTTNTKTISSGTNRLLVVYIYAEDTATDANVNTVTYGGQTLTEVNEQTLDDAGEQNTLWMGYLTEAQIALASGSTITPTWIGGGTPTPNNGIQYSAAVFQNVDQTSPIRASSGNVVTVSNAITPASTIAVLDGDVTVYGAMTADGINHTVATGYTVGTEQDTGGSGFISVSAYKAITANGTEFPEAQWSGSGDRQLMVAATIASAPSEGVILSQAIDFDWVSGQTDWGEISWNVTESAGSDTRLQVYYGSTTDCSTLVPNGTLSGNAAGFTATASPLSIVSLATSTYNRICVKMTLDEDTASTSPTLNDWTVSWELSPVFDQTTFRWFANTASATPTDTWPEGATASELVQNESMSATYPTQTDDVLRLRMGVSVSSVSASSRTFILQYAEGTTCSADMEWLNVGAIGSTTALWRGYNNTGLTDGQTLASSTLDGADTLETYEEENLSATMPNTISVSARGEWDWAIQNRADSGTEYCFRMVGSDGSPFADYTEYPQVVTNFSPSIADSDTPFDNEKLASTSPWFEFTGVDPEVDSIDYQIQIDDNNDFSSTVIDTNSVSNLDDFLNISNPSNKSPFDDSQSIRYTIPSALTNGVTYWWRVRAVDTEASTIYGDWMTARSFTIDTSATTTSTWFQTTEEQFDTNTLVGTDATASDLVTLITGSTTGTTTSSGIDFDDVTIGNAWGTLSWTDAEPPGDIKYHMEYYTGSDWTLISDSALTGNAAGFDTSPVDLIDLDTEIYNQIRIRANFTSTSTLPTLSNWTVSWGLRVSVPTHVSLFDNEKSPTTTPTFTFYTTDPQGSDLEYEFSWSTDNTFATGSTTRNSSTSPNFTNTEAVDTNPFISGDVISYKIPSTTPLTNGTTYWWRLRAKDPTGGNSFSFWSDPWSFTIATSATTSTWFQTTQEQFDTDTIVSLVASTSDSVSTIAAGVSTYTFAGITNPSGSHVARYFEVDVLAPTDPPTVDEIDTLTLLGTVASTPNLRTAIAGYATDAEASSAQYTSLSVSDNNSWTTTDPGAGDNAVFWAEFEIAEDPSDVSEISVLIEARQGGTPVAGTAGWFGIWRPGSTTPYWQVASTSLRTTDTNYTATFTTNLTQYFDGSNKLHLIYFNEDVSDPVIVDYVQVVITSATADSGTLTGTELDFNDGSGPAWGEFSWVDSEPGFSTLEYQIEYLNGVGVWALIPDSALSGNAAGFSSGPVNLEALDTTTYNEIRPVANFACSLGSCPTLSDWTITWSPGFSVSGTAFEYDGTSSTTSGTVAVAVNGVLQTGKTGTISNGSWIINDVTFFEDDVVTVFVSDATTTATSEAVAITQYDGAPDITGMRLQKRHLTIGSNDYATIDNTEIELYDFSDNENLFFDVDAGNDLSMCADVGCGDGSIRILAQNTYDPGTGGNVTTHDFTNYGTLTAGANTLRVSGSWDDNATTTLTGSTVIFTATSSTESIDETNATTTGFNNVTFGETSGTATWNASSTIDINGNLIVSRGTFARGTTPITIAGNLTTEANGLWTGMGTTTFDGTNPSTWTDQNAALQNIGRVVVDGTAKTLLLGSTTTAQSVTIGADDTFDASITGHTISVFENWINNNTFTARTGKVIFVATTTNRIITQGGDPFYNLTFSGAGGAWAFTEADLTVTNDFTIATGTVTMPTGTTTITGSFSSVGGTFAHNNALVYFNSSSAETIAASGTPFTNAFYNLRFTGSGSWSFLDTSATTSNDLLITQGTVVLPSNTLSLGGSFTQSGGAFTHNSGTVKFTSATAETIDISGSSFNHLSFTGTGSRSFVDASITTLGNISVTGGTVVLPSGTLTLGGSFTNSATTTHNSGTVLFNSTDTGETINLGNSPLYNMTFNSLTGGWTIAAHATTTNNFTLSTTSTFTLTSGQTLAVGGTFTNDTRNASTTWTGSTLSLEAGSYTINSKTNNGEAYGTLRVKANTDIKMWNSTSTAYVVDATGSLYSQDHNGVDGDLYVFGEYVRTSGTEYWSYATDFDGSALTASTSRQVDVRLAADASVNISNSTFQILGDSAATTTIANQGSGTYGVTMTHGTTTFNYYDFANLGASGVRLAGTGVVTSLNDGSFEPGINAGTGLTIASTTIDANAGLQIYRVDFSTSTAISATNVTQTDSTPTSYWWFRSSTGNIDGEAFDNDTGDPGSIRWDDSSLVITVSGVVYSDDGVTPMGIATCDGFTANIRIVVQGGSAYTGSCAVGTGVYNIGGVVVIGDPVVTTYLNTNGGAQGTVITRTPTADITDLDIYQNRVITRHEDSAPLTILNMAAYDTDDDSDIRYTAATGTLTVFSNTELHIASSTTFVPGGDIAIYGNASSTVFDGSLHIDDNATFTGAGTATYTIGGSFTMDTGATFTSASTTVVMNATTTGKTITTDATQEITFNNLEFNGLGGAWNINGDVRAIQDVDVATGTVSGTADITVVNGSLSGNGLLSMGAGTTTINNTNTLGGTTAWTFANLVLGNGSITGTTTPASTATTTILGKLTISTGHYLDAGSSLWNLAGSGNVFTESGTFLEDTSTLRYSGTGATNILSTTYYNLDLKAQGGSPTYTGVGLGIIVTNDLRVGGATTTTVTFDTSDPALDVNGNVTIDTTGTLIGSASAAFTVAGNWDNNGAYTGSNGTVTFDGSGTPNIAAGNSSFSSVIINGTGAFTISEHATATAAFTLTNAGSYTLASGQSLGVGGTFTNSVGGAGTTWTGSSLHLYGGGNYQINASTTNDTYNLLTIGSATQIRMWNSSASTYDLASTASLYSQDHSAVNGDLYIYGAYTKTSGNDYWNYATDFDGTNLTGGERNVDVYIASGGSVLYTGGGLAVVGSASASTTIQNQGSGTYTFRIGGTASTTWTNYYMQHMNASGLTFSGTPNVVTLSYGEIIVSTGGGSALTVGGTTITQNPAKTFTNNNFSTSTGISGFNVTATGTAASSWRFTNHSGSIDGEALDVDPDGDPGYIVWDDSAANITISGTVYSGEGSGVSTACDDVTSNIHLRVAGLTSYTGTCDSGDGTYSISGVLYSPGDSLVVYIDGETEKAATVTEDPVSSISGLDLYENRVIVRHESADPLSIADMAAWDSSDDADIPFTAVDAGTDTLTLPSDRKLIVWTGKEFEPNGNVTVTGGGGGAAYDGTLELYASASFDATGSETHTIGGNLISGVGASIDDETSTFIFTTSGAGRTIDTNEDTLYNLTMNGSGSWTVTNAALQIGNDFTITQGAVTLPNSTTTITGSLSVTGGSFVASGGTLLFNSGAGETIRPGSSSMSALTINGSGSFTLLGGNATATANVTIIDGAFTSATGTFAIGGSFVNRDTLTHNSGTLKFTAGSAALLTAGGSDLSSVTFAGTGPFTFTDTNVALTGSLTIQSGSVTFATGTMSIAGSLLNTGGTFNHSSGTVLFNSSDTGESINLGVSSLYNVSFASAGGGWTITNNATTTGNFTLSSATSFAVSSSTRLYVGGVFTNLVGGGATTWTGSTLSINSGSSYTINTKIAGGDTYNTLLIGSSTNLRSWDSTGNVTILDGSSSLYSQDHAGVPGSLYIYGNYTRTTGIDYWSYATDFDGTALAGSSRQAFVYFGSGATTTVTGGTLNIVGANGFDTTISNQGSGTYTLDVFGGTFNAYYYSFSNMDADGLTLLGTTTVTSLDEGNFTLGINGGSLITVSSTTINYNTGIVISGMSFATTTAITGTNITVIGSTPSAWTFTGHTGNLDGEAYDDDGIDDCGSIRWDDSTCLLTQQSAYRFRNDDGGEGVPDSEWFDLDWTKRKRVVVTNTDAVSYTNAAVKLTVAFDSDMQSDFDDIRFTNSTGVTAINHFVESYTASTEAVIWVEIPTLATSTDTEVYMYYGNGVVSDGSSSSTFNFIDTYEDGNITEYSGDTGEFTVDSSGAYERTYRLEASDPINGKTDVGGMYNNSVTVSQGEKLRFLKYIDTSAPPSGGAADEVCTLFGTQTQTTNYGVCLELFGVDRMSLVQDVLHRDTSGTVLASTTVSYSTGWYEVEVDWDTDDTIFVTLSQNGSIVATTSATDTSYTSGGVGYTLWGYHGGWDVYSARPLLDTEPTSTFGFEQVSGGATWAQALNTPGSGISIDENFRVRFLIENTGLTITDQNFEIEYAPKGVAPSCEAVSFSAYAEVPNEASCGTSEICMETSTHITNLASTTDIFGGEGTFTYGQIVEDPSNNTGNITVDASEFTELEYTLKTTSNAADSNYCLRVSNEGTDLDSYAHVAELSLLFEPNITVLSLNGGNDITLTGGATTTVYATGTVTDQNGYTDLAGATTTIFRSGVGEACSLDNNNCYISGNSQCSFTNCSGNSCDIVCSADIYYHADPTDIGTYAAETWRALLAVTDSGASVATATAPSIDLITLRAISVDSSINYGSLEVNADTGSYNATTTVENIGNDALDISIEGTDLTDGGASTIPVAEQIFATSTFTYSACVFCSSLDTVASNLELDLSKPSTTTPAVTDQVFWGIAVPFGVSGTAHQGINTFYAIGDI